jgi:hypothetical protein
MIRKPEKPKEVTTILNSAIQEKYEKGLKDGLQLFKDELIANIRNDIKWIGEEREKELMDYIHKTYIAIKYRKGQL